MRRLRIPVLYDIQYQSPQPLVPRRLRYEVAERIGPRGETLARARRGAGARRSRERIREADVEAVAIALLHSYADDAHERRVEEIVRAAVGDGVYVTRSSEILPEIREYERTSTAVVNAYVGPAITRYLGSLVDRLREAGIARAARGDAVERRHARRPRRRGASRPTWSSRAPRPA